MLVHLLTGCLRCNETFDDRAESCTSVRSSALMSLPGHTSAIDAVTFDRTEETLVAGCSGGSLKIWNLEQQKVAGTLTGCPPPGGCRALEAVHDLRAY